jgi:glycosyltransferase involved in cell wall biosynthesis
MQVAEHLEVPHVAGMRESRGDASRKVRVVFINDTARNGGPGRSLESILRFLDPNVVHRTVVLPRAGAVSDLLAAAGVTDEIHLEPNFVENPIEPWGRSIERGDLAAPWLLKAPRAAGNIVKAFRALARLRSLVRREHYDLIYCNGTSADFAGAALAWLTGVPALWHVRYTSVPHLLRRLHRSLSASAGVVRIVCVSNAAAVLFSHCNDKVRVIHNALDVNAFDPAHVRGALRSELGLPASAIVFGSHGRVLRRKGYVEMLHAARSALDRVTQAERTSLFFVIIGDTPEDFRPDHVEECRALAADLGIADRVRMTGFRSDVRSFVVDFDAAVVPSVYADPLPRTVIEAMSLGKPVIAFDVGGVVEMIEPGITGELVAFEAAAGGREGASSRAIERMADAFIRYAREPLLRERQGRAARERIVRDFDARAHARRIQDEIVVASGREVRDR